MRWPWQDFEFHAGGKVLTRGQLARRVLGLWPKGGNINIEMGDNTVLALKKEDSDAMWWRLPNIVATYTKATFDCENFTQTRLAQVADFVADSTDLRTPPAIFEIRGRIFRSGIGHSMLFEVFSDHPPILRQPYNDLTEEDLGYLSDPWLIYQ